MSEDHQDLEGQSAIIENGKIIAEPGEAGLAAAHAFAVAAGLTHLPVVQRAVRTNVFEGAPDRRQSANMDEPLSRFRPVYKAQPPERLKLIDDLKTKATELESLIDDVPKGRYQALAYTALEEAIMWAVKSATGP